MAKVAKNLSLDPDVVRRAEEYAAARGISLSQLVGELLDRVTRSADPVLEFSPTVQRLLGVARDGDPEPDPQLDYHEHLERKYLRS